MHKLSLNIDVASNFRNTVNEYVNLSLNKKYKRKNKKESLAWNTICTIMDRVDDLVIYLNQKELDTGKWTRCAFDFFEFIEQAGVLVECIDEAYKIYSVEFPKHSTIFKSKKIDMSYMTEKYQQKDLDDEYFKYIRSLSSVHPSDTDRHRIFQEADFEVSPYVIWNPGVLLSDNENADLVLVTYNNETQEFLNNKSIIISELFNYIKYKYYSLNYLSKKIKYLNEYEINIMRKKKIKKVIEFSSYDKYLENILEEAQERNPDMISDVEEIIEIFKLKLSNESNNEKFDKYKNALKYAMINIHRQLQNMDFNCISPADRMLSELLLGDIYIKDSTEINYHYPLSKIVYLKEKSGDKIWALKMYEQLLNFFENYIEISKEDIYNCSYIELYILSQIALYYHALEHNNIINEYIPESEEYRLGTI